MLVAGRRALYLLRRLKNDLCSTAPANPSSKKSPIQISSESYGDALFATLQCIGQAHTSLSNYSLARDACSESLHMSWEKALSSSTTSASMADKSKELTKSILQVIRALKRLGKVYLLQKQYSLSLECFLPSLELLRSSVEMESTMDCASVLGSLGFLYLKLKKYTEASNFLRSCLRLYESNGEFIYATSYIPYPPPRAPLIKSSSISLVFVGVDVNDRETRKVQAWLQMAESREEEAGVTPPSFLEIPTIVFNDAVENSN